MIDQEYPVSGRAAAKVELRSGRLQVLPGPSDAVRLAVDGREPRAVQRGHLIEVSSRSRSTITLWIPADSDLEVSTASAPIQVEVEVGRLEGSTASGDLRFGTVRALAMRSASGDVTGEEVTEGARCFTASGYIRIGSLAGIGELSTASGDVSLGVVEGELSITTLSGDMRVARLTGPSLTVRSMSGDLRVGIPPRSRVDLDVNTRAGKVSLPEGGGAEPPQRQITLKANLVSGDIRVERVS